MKTIVRTIVNQIGAFAFLLSLALKPRVLTSAQSGDVQLFGLLPSTVLCLVAMGLWSIVCVACFFLPEKARNAFFRFLGPLQIAVPALVTVLLFAVQAPFVPIVVSVALGITCVSQVLLASRANRLDSKRCLFSVGLAFCAAGLISDLAFTLPSIHMYGNIVIALVMVASGVTILRNSNVESTERATNAALENAAAQANATAGAPLSPSALFSKMGPIGFAIVLGNLMCALCLGTAWVTNVFDNGQADLGLCIAGTLLGAAFALSLYKFWPKLADDAWLVYAFIVPLGIAFLLFVFSDCRQSGLFFVLGLASEYGFFTVIWSSMFVLDRSVARPGLVAVAYLAVFTLLLAASIVLCSAFGDVVLRRVFSIATLAFLLWLIYFSAKRNAGIPEFHALSAAEGARKAQNGTEAVEASSAAPSDASSAFKPSASTTASEEPILTDDASTSLDSVSAFANGSPVSVADAPTPAEPLAADAIIERCEHLAQQHDLSPRETELLPFFVMGFSAASIGKRLFISPETVKTHRSRIYRKLGVSKHEDLVELAINLPK